MNKNIKYFSFCNCIYISQFQISILLVVYLKYRAYMANIGDILANLGKILGKLKNIGGLSMLIVLRGGRSCPEQASGCRGTGR